MPYTEFIHILNECRVGIPSQESIGALHRLSRPLHPLFLPHLRPVELYALRRLVDVTNKRHLDQLPGPLFQFHAVDRASHPHSLHYYSDMPVDPFIGLKIGAQVMLRKNLGNGLFNGSIGTVLSFLPSEALVRCGNDHAQWGDGCVRHIEPSRIPSSSPPSPDAYPLVCFKTPMGDEHVFCRPEVFKVEDSRGQTVALRTQVYNGSNHT